MDDKVWDLLEDITEKDEYDDLHSNSNNIDDVRLLRGVINLHGGGLCVDSSYTINEPQASGMLFAGADSLNELRVDINNLRESVNSKVDIESFDELCYDVEDLGCDIEKLRSAVSSLYEEFIKLSNWLGETNESVINLHDFNIGGAGNDTRM